MPTVQRHRTISPRTGLSSHRRKARYKALCESGANRTNAASIISNSLYSLELKPIKSMQVMVKQEQPESDPSMLYDLIDSFQHMHNQVHASEKDLSHLYLLPSHIERLDFLVEEFSKLVPMGMYFNIDSEETGFHFTIYAMPEFTHQWYCIPIEDACKRLRRQPKLYDLFIRFIGKFIEMTGVDPWWGYSMEPSREYMNTRLEDERQEVLDMGQEIEPWMKSWEKTMHEYVSGKPAHVEHQIRSLFPEHVSHLKAEVATLTVRKNKDIRDLIIEGCDIIEQPFTIGELTYDIYHGRDDIHNYYMPFEYEFNIVWSYNDILFQEQESYLDSMYQEGAQDPAAHVKIIPNTDTNLDVLYRHSAWLDQLTNYMTKLSEALTNE